MTARLAWGLGLATVTDTGRTLDIWYPEPQLGPAPKERNSPLLKRLTELETADEVRRVQTSVVLAVADLDDTPSSTADAYLRLHLLSHRLVKPNTINLDGIYARLPTVAWTSMGPCSHIDFEETRIRMRTKYGYAFHVVAVDKFPAMSNYVVPSGVRIGEGASVRLGAYLASGTTVMHAAFINYNAGTLGRTMVEGTISQGVVIGEGSAVGSGASTMGFTGGNTRDRVSLGQRCLLGANSGLGIPLGDDCVVESGLYLTATTKVALLPFGGVLPGAHGLFTDPQTVPAYELAGASNVLFRRNSVSGRVEALPRAGKSIELNPNYQAD